MNWKQLPLHYQITALVLSLVLLLSSCFALLSLWSSQSYHNETTQRIYDGLAQYIVDHQSKPIIENGVSNIPVLQQIAMQTMAINPLVEVYLLGPKGDILAHALPDKRVQLSRVALEPIQKRLAGLRGEPEYGFSLFVDTRTVLGDNPTEPDQPRLFSVAALFERGVLVGYLYVVINSDLVGSVTEQLYESHIAKMIVFGAICLSVFALTIGWFSFWLLTKPLRTISNEMNQFQQSDWMSTQLSDHHVNRNEISLIKSSFLNMKQRIVSQFNALQENSRLRRELIANVSHDLRTPLASMQGYVEILLLKKGSLTPADEERYLKTVHRNSRRLTALVTELFELSKLESGQIEPKCEVFSLLELVFDIVQDFDLLAKKRQVKIEVESEQVPYQVYADIGLIQRVLQNLIDNALRFTPVGGRIGIRLSMQRGKVFVAVTDNGEGIREKDLPFIFEAYFTSHDNRIAATDESDSAEEEGKLGTGLGLAISKRILQLHHADIEVMSPSQEGGAEFRFFLNSQPAME